MKKFTKLYIKKPNLKKPNFLNKLGYFLAVSSMALMLGMIISSQDKTYHGVGHGGIATAKRLNEMLLILKETKNKNVGLEKQLASMKTEFKKLDKQNYSTELSKKHFKIIYEIAGFTQVKGNGIVIKLNNSSNSNNISSEYDNLVHSDDLLKIVNELKASGARAISINNQRLITTTEITTSGKTIVVNRVKISPPYIISAVGPSDMMISALKIQGGIFEYLNVFGIHFDIRKKGNLTIPAYSKTDLN